MLPDLGGISAPNGQHMGWCPGLKVLRCCCTGLCLDGESRQEVRLGWHSPPVDTLPVRLGRRMLRLYAPLPRLYLPQNGELALGSMSTVAQSSTTVGLLLSRDGVFGCGL